MSHDQEIDFADVLRGRRATYQFLSRLFRVEVDQELHDTLVSMRFPTNTGNALVDEGYRMICGYLSQADGTVLTELAVDYVRAFIGSGNDGFSAAYPYESVYTSPKRLMMQDARDEVLVLYRAFGLDKQESWKEGEDHIALELEFEQILCERAIAAYEAGDEDECLKLLLSQRNFLEDHLLAWYPMMAADLQKFPQTDFYKGLGRQADRRLPAQRPGVPGRRAVRERSRSRGCMMDEHDVERKRDAGPRVSRRTFALGAVGACAVIGLGGVKYLPSASLLRPPGGQDEEQLVRGCLHCEKCREVCPKHAIAPAHLEDGILNARTPRMDFKSGWCDFCENEPGGPKCVAVCPTHALVCPDPSQVIIGKAELNRDWCLAAKGMGCHECVDVCNYEALELGADNVPVVDVDACNGCGACELACISLSAGSITAGATDRAIVIRPTEEVEA